MWDEMYEEFWDKLEHFCAKLCRDESRAEDLTQEVFLKALMNRSLIESFNARQCKDGCLPRPGTSTATKCAARPRSGS